VAETPGVTLNKTNDMNTIDQKTSDQLVRCGELVEAASLKAPKRFETFKELLINRSKKQGRSILETAIDLCMEDKYDAVLHLWYMGTAALLIRDGIK
jgi:hypothetical protein